MDNGRRGVDHVPSDGRPRPHFETYKIRFLRPGTVCRKTPAENHCERSKNIWKRTECEYISRKRGGQTTRYFCFNDRSENNTVTIADRVGQAPFRKLIALVF